MGVGSLALDREEVCQIQGWEFKAARFYTDIPDEADNPRWNYFWAGKLLQSSRQGVDVHSRPLRYRNKVVRLPDGSTHAFLTGDEKGIDVPDILRLVGLDADNDLPAMPIAHGDNLFSPVNGTHVHDGWSFRSSELRHLPLRKSARPFTPATEPRRARSPAPPAPVAVRLHLPICRD